MAEKDRFDPLAVLAALERNYVHYVLIGGLAQVLRGADLITAGVDICPSPRPDSLQRLSQATSELDARPADRRARLADERWLAEQEIVRLSTSAGPLNVVLEPAGAPRGFLDLRTAATREPLGDGLQPSVASTRDLARLAVTLHRNKDGPRLAQLRRIIELEANRVRTIPRGPSIDRSVRVPDYSIQRGPTIKP